MLWLLFFSVVLSCKCQLSTCVSVCSDWSSVEASGWFVCVCVCLDMSTTTLLARILHWVAGLQCLP